MANYVGRLTRLHDRDTVRVAPLCLLKQAPRHLAKRPHVLQMQRLLLLV